ncbi:hypothetical protein [Paraburkholderia acidisoli]|uniref:Uncharacterized protein n=1 Tax=Paraburkholderia acidisoli TaxID=2571748 RepID=A0A7Z2GPF6_9BURK|nr:hypothetical protein [Paraburkholderia acidisoli]QGZ65164.1 hypothetical protein FAZ98_25670 [Paraburkholderia acidisoli]
MVRIGSNDAIHESGNHHTGEPAGGNRPNAGTPTRPPEHHALGGLARMRAPSPSRSGSTKRTGSPVDESGADTPNKRPRFNAILPERAEAKSPASESEWHHSMAMASSNVQTSPVAATSAVSAAAGVKPLGGKVLDAPGLALHTGVPQGAQVGKMEARIKETLRAEHGEVEVFGYHVTTQENANAIRQHGFSAEANQGKGGGIGGKNFHGAGLYTSSEPTDGYAQADKTNVMFAVVHPAKAELKPGKVHTHNAWEAPVSAPGHQGDYIAGTDTGESERKIHPEAIAKFGLVEVAHIPPSMPDHLLKMRANMAAAPTSGPPKHVTPELADWVRNKTAGTPELAAIKAEPDREQKVDLIYHHAGQLAAQARDPNITQRLVTMALKQDHLPPE